MIFQKTKLDGLYIIESEPKMDDRGYLMRIFCEDELKKNDLGFKIVQASRTLTNKKGTIRGMHFQQPPKEEDKIVQCLRGAIYDVAVDLRTNSKTYGQWVAEELSENNKKMFLIPRGFAHGFQTLTDDCQLLYFMSEFYSPEYASAVRWNDPSFKIKWPLKNPTLSEKDKNWPLISIKL